MVLFVNIFFLLCRKNHTLVATWTFSNAEDNDVGVNKTVSGCVSGQPIIFLHKQNIDTGAWCYIKPTAGVVNIARNHHYVLGTESGNDQIGGPNNFILIPNKTSITVNILPIGNDDTVYVFKQQ